MLTNWFSQPAGARSSTDDGKSGDAEDDTQVMEPDQGNGEYRNDDARAMAKMAD